VRVRDCGFGVAVAARRKWGAGKDRGTRTERGWRRVRRVSVTRVAVLGIAQGFNVFGGVGSRWSVRYTVGRETLNSSARLSETPRHDHHSMSPALEN
jgi:hypothetical protein